MIRQRGVDDLPYLNLSPATVKQKAKISAATANKRMIRTKFFLNNAFQFVADARQLKVFITNRVHGRDISTATKKSTRKALAVKKFSAGQTLDQIASWQLQTGAAKFFPTNSLEVENLDAVEIGRKDLKAEILRQIRSKGLMKVRQVLNLG